MAVAPSERAPGAAGLGEAAGENMEAPPRLEATLELTLLRDWQTCQVSGGWTAGPGCRLLQPWTDTFWRVNGVKGCPGLQLLSLTNSSWLTYQFFRLILDQHHLCSLRAPFSRVLDVTQVDKNLCAIMPPS